MSEVTYPVKMPRCRIDDGSALTSFTIRETDGKDEEYAAQRAKAKGGDATTTEELIRVCLVAVNGTPVAQPYEALAKWNSRARSLLVTAWRHLNTTSDKEDADFLAGAEDEAPAAPAR